jgi:hypothetical protein
VVEKMLGEAGGLLEAERATRDWVREVALKKAEGRLKWLGVGGSEVEVSD